MILSVWTRFANRKWRNELVSKGNSKRMNFRDCFQFGYMYAGLEMIADGGYANKKRAIFASDGARISMANGRIELRDSLLRV